MIAFRKKFSRKKTLLIFLMVLSLLMQLFLQITHISATQILNFSPYITSVSITDENNSPFDINTPIDKKSEIKVKYDFHIDSATNVYKENEEIFYEVKLPEQLKIEEEMTGKITATGSSVSIGEISSSNSLLKAVDDSKQPKNMKAPEQLNKQSENDTAAIAESKKKEETDTVKDSAVVNSEENEQKDVNQEEKIEQPVKEKTNNKQEEIQTPVNTDEKVEEKTESKEPENNITEQKSDAKEEIAVDTEAEPNINEEALKTQETQQEEIVEEEIQEINEEVDDGSIGTITVRPDKKAIIKFNKNILKNPININGSFTITSSFDLKKVEGGGEQKLVFEINGSSKEITINLANDNPTISKKGEYDSSTNEIIWTIEVNTNGNSYNNLSVVDSIPGSNHTFIENGFTDGASNGNCLIDDKLADPLKCSYTTTEFKYNFKENFNGKAVIKVKTKPTAEAMSKVGNKILENNVKLIDGSTELANSSANVDVTIDPIVKDGSYNYDKDNAAIIWTIEINNSNMHMDKPTIEDKLLDGRIKPGDEAGRQKILDSIKLVDKAGNDCSSLGTATLEDSTLKYEFQNDIDCYYKLTFETPIIWEGVDDYLVNNTATLIFKDFKIGSNEKVVMITSPIRKCGEYKDDTNTIEWTVYVNEMSNNLGKVYLKDYIRGNHNYNKGSLKVYNWDPSKGYDVDESSSFGNIKDDYTPCDRAVPGTEYKETGELTIKFLDDVKAPYIIKYSTTPSKEMFISDKGLSGSRFSNWCDLYKEGTDKPIAASEYSLSKIIKTFDKQADEYNRNDNTITWRLIVNQEKAVLDVDKASVTDEIPDELKFKQDSIKIYKNDDVNALGESSECVGKYDESSKTVNVEFKQQTVNGKIKQLIQDKYVIEFKTEVVDFSKSTSPDHCYRNTASLNIEDGNLKYVLSDYEDVKVVNNDFIVKTIDKASSSKSSVKWNILIDFTSIKDIYPDAIIKDAVIEDNLKDMTLDRSIPVTLYNGDKENEAEKIDWNPEISDSKNMVINLPDLKVDSKYLLTFRTNVKKGNKNVQNSVSFKCKGYTGSADSGVIELKSQSLDVVGGGESNSVTVIKKDSKGNPLGNAEFGLYKKSYNEGSAKPIFESTGDTQFSDPATGEAVFKNLGYGSYVIKEIAPPDGYEKTEKEYEFMMNGEKPVPLSDGDNVFINNKKSSGGGSHHHHHHDDDDDDYGSIKIRKVDENKNVLKGAEFTLTDLKGIKVESAVTNEYGIALFEDVPFGNYLIKETKGIEGYEIENMPITTEIKSKSQKSYTVVNKKKEEGKDINKDKVIIIPSDKEHMGSIKVVKVNENNEVLTGAQMGIYNESGMSLGNKITDKDGIVIFENLPFGKYTIKEIKAPGGYILSNEKIEVSLDSKGMKSVDFINTKEDYKESSNKVEKKILPNVDKKISSSISKAKTKIRSILPKSGSLFDTKMIAGLGVLVLCIGLAIYLKKGCKGWK